MSDNMKRQPAGVPTGGQFAANEHDEAAPLLVTPPMCDRHGGEWGSDPTCETCTDEDGNVRPFDEDADLGPGAVDHNALMAMGETRALPVTDIDFGEVTVTRDEDTGIENVSVIVAPDQWGRSRDYDSDEDRVQFLAHYDGVTGTATRVESESNDEWAPEYSYEVTLHNPYTDETVKIPWGTGSSESHERTPRAADVLHSLVTDAASARDRTIEEWYDVYGYEPDWEAESYGEDPYDKYRSIYDGCVEADRKAQSFLGRRYDDYMWGNDDSSSLRVTFKDGAR